MIASYRSELMCMVRCVNVEMVSSTINDREDGNFAKIRD